MRNTISNLLTPKGRWLPTLLLLFTLGIGNVWAADPTHESPSIVEKANRTFLNLAGTPSNVTVSTDSYSNYGPGYFISNKNADLSASWWSFTGTFKSSSSSYSNVSGAVGFHDVGSSSSSEFYQILQMRTGSDRMTQMDFYVTGTTQMGFQWKNGGTSGKYLTFSIYEMDVTGATATDGASPVSTVQGTTTSNSDQYAASATLDGSKYYHVVVTPLNTSNINFYGLTFKHAPAATYAVTYKSGDGSGDDVVDDDATVVGGCPSTFSYTGYDFAGWKDGDNNDVEVGDAVTSDMTLTAQWTVHVAKYTVKYLDGTTELGSEEVNVGSTPAGLASNPTKDCYTFAAWSPALSSVSGSDGDVVEVNATWTPKYASTLDFAAVTIAGTTGANPIGTFLASGNMVASNLGGDSGWETSTAKSGFIGYKLKNTSAVVKFLVKAGKEVEITLGSVGAAAKLNKGGVESEIAKKSGDNEQTVIPAFVAESDMLVTITTNASSNSTVTLKKISIVDPAPKYTVTYALNGATGTTPTEVDHKAGEKFNLHDGVTGITAPTNKTFVNWKDQDDALFNGGAEYTMPAKNVTMTAQWAGDVYTVKFMDGETVLDTKVVEVGSHPTDIEHPTKPLYTFAAWQLSGSDVVLDDVTGTKDATVILTARWAKAYATSYDMEAYAASDGASKAGLETALTAAGYAYTNINGIDNGHTHNYTYDGLKYKTNDGDLSFYVVAGKVVEVKTGHLPSNDAVTMYINGVADATVFEGADEAQETHKMNYFYSAAEALYRLDVKASKGTCAVKKVTIRDPYTVSYNPHGADPIAAQYGTPKVTLPTPANGTGVFKGWYDAETAGNKIGNAGAEYMPTANITLHAQWETLSSDNTLASWKIDGVAKDVPVSRILYIEEPYGVTPVISEAVATANVGLETPIATVAVSNTPVHYQDATEDFWYVQAEVTPQDPTAAHGYYQVRYTNAPKLGATIFKAELTAANDADYSGMYADADNSEIALVVDPDNNNEYKFSGKSNYIKMDLADATFAEGDVLKMTYTTNPQQGELAIYDGTTKLQGTPYSNNTLTFSDAVGTNKSTLYIRRTDDNKFNGWVAAVEVQRYMAPIIKSYKIGAVSGTIDQDLKTIAIELPYGTTLSGVAATIEAYANGGATIIAPTPLAYDTPLGYKVSSAYAEDGDVDYTVTITEAEHYEAMIVGGANYTTLLAAVAAAQADDVVKLLDNVDLMATGLTIAENMTLDLNGFNIKAGEQIDNDIFVPAGKKLTLVDNSEGAHGKIYTEQAYTGAVTGYGLIRVAGELLMQSGNIYAVIDSDPANLGQFAVVVAPAGKVTVAGGQIKAGWYAISNSGNNTGSTIIVSGGELISTADFAIYNPAKESTVTVSGGVVYGAAGGIAMNRGELTVTGGTITSKDQGTTGTWGDGTGGLSNAAISASGKYESVEVEISGGTIIAEGTAVMITNGTTNPVEVAISGGQFSHVVPAEYCADGFAPVTEPNAQGKYEVEDKRIYIFNGSTMSDMAESPSAGAITWAKVGSTMSATSKNGTYDEVSYTKALQSGNSSTTKHFRIDVALNNNAKIEVIGMSNSDSDTRHAWLTNSTDKGEIANAIASLETAGYNPEYFTTDWLEEGSYYLHSDNTVNIFLIRVTEKAVDPKCEVPTITTQPATDLTFGAGNMTATVEAEVSDEGTLTYQWYNAANDEAVVGQTTATLTTADEGTYYVIVTNTKASHRDNSIKSDEAQLAHRVMDDATLSALSASEGTLDPTFDKDVEEYRVDLPEGTVDVPTLSATATMDGYANVAINNATAFVNYEATSTVVVTSEDGTASKTYTVKFYVDHLLPQVDVTESTTWDWTYAAEGTVTIKVTDSTEPIKKNEEGLMANVRVDDNKPTNDATFNSQALLFYGENVRAKDGGRWYASLGHIKFNVTVPGKVTVEFSDNGTNNRRLKINDQMSESSSSKTDVKTFAAYVEAGEVTLMGVEEDGTGSNKYIRISKIEFTTADESRANLQLGGIGTVCLPFDVATTDRFGGTFYKADYQGPGFAYFLEETGTLEAGKPYVYVADTTFIVLLQDANANTVNDPIPDRGMYGTFTDMAAGSLTDKYVIAQKKLRRCGTGATLAAYRAYIDLNEMPTTPLVVNDPANAPVRRRLGIGGNNGSTTDLQNYFEFNAEGTQKVIMNGQLYILRDGKMYNAQGQLMK